MTQPRSNAVRTSEKQLPNAWAWVAMGETGSWSGGGTPSKDNPEYWTKGKVPWVSPKDMKSSENGETEDYVTDDAVRESATAKVPAGSVLVVTRSGILRHSLPVAVTRLPVAINQGLKAPTPHAGISSDFIAYAFQAQEKQILHSCTKDGTAVQSIEFPSLKRILIPLPPSPEQARIADARDKLFSDLDAGVAALERAREKLKPYRASVLKAAVEGALTADWREQHPHAEPASELLKRILVERRRRWEEDRLAKFKATGQETPNNWKTRDKEPVAPDTKDLPSLPEGWCWGTIEQVGEVRLGRQRAPQHHHGDHMRPYLRVANVYEDRLDPRDVKSMNFTPEEFVAYALRVGDILLNEGQSPELVGRPAMYRGEIPGCCYQKTLLRFRASPGVDARYALIAFRACLHNGRFRRSSSITTSIAHLAAERFAGIEFPLPLLAEQEAIVEAVEDQLSVIDHLELDIDAKLKSAQALRQAILRYAFAGKLVPQDPSDEPASELLKRIAAEREARARDAVDRRREQKRAPKPPLPPFAKGGGRGRKAKG